MTRVVLDAGAAEGDRARAGSCGSGRRMRGMLVGRVGDVWKAYANVCRHRALPLDLGADRR